MRNALTLTCVLLGLVAVSGAQETVKVGLNYPKTGPYSAQGLDQWRCAQLAAEEINAAGGILGKPLEIVWRDSMSKADHSTNNANDLIDNEGVQMIFGGSSSGVAVAVGKVCQEKSVPFFGTLTYSTATTGKEGRRYVFRECYDAWAGAKVLADYLNKNHAGKKYFYVTADYTWGHTTEASMRHFTETGDEKQHRGVKTPFPGAQDADFKKALSFAKVVKPDVLVLVLFGKDMERAVRQATLMGFKGKMEIVVPNLTLGMAEGGGAKVMEGVVGAVPWCWRVPSKYGYERGQAFVDAYVAKHQRYPSTSGASAYTILYEYKAACERAQATTGPAIVKALEGHSYQLLKDQQTWRAFDHQSLQTVYAVRCKKKEEVEADQFGLDFFEIIAELDGKTAFRTFQEWAEVRKAAGKPEHLDLLPGESPADVKAND